MGLDTELLTLTENGQPAVGTMPAAIPQSRGIEPPPVAVAQTEAQPAPDVTEPKQDDKKKRGFWGWLFGKHDGDSGGDVIAK